jgi:hypothetical protein
MSSFLESLMVYRQELLKLQVALFLISFAGTLIIVSAHHFLRFWIPYEFYKHDPEFMKTLYNINKKHDKQFDWRYVFYALCLLVIILGLILGKLFALDSNIEFLNSFVRYDK